MQKQLFNPEEVLQVAAHLSTQGGEANDRSAISRAYYGVFLMARNVAGIEDETSRSHRITRAHYVELGEKDIADDLWTLRDERNRADYETRIRVTPARCLQAMVISRRLRLALKVIAGRANYRALVSTNVVTS
jgi:uncharacterized protein (UPF0332 family)